jgi:hydroxyacylglutathione hydrolase
MPAVLHVPAFDDNYIWLLSGRTPGAIAVVDPGDAASVLARCEHDGLTPVAILCTHHHGDHVGGVEELHRRFPVPVYGPARERIPVLTHPLAGGERLMLDALGIALDVLAVPGHTLGHIAYYGNGKLFCGDTLFSAGCGRLFEGTAAQMHASLMHLASLPGETEVYCAHEYTEANLRFAMTVEPDNPDIREYRRTVSARRRDGLPSLPTTIARERCINPFLRASEPTVRQSVERMAGQPLRSDLEVFTCLRRWKDGFRG